MNRSTTLLFAAAVAVAALLGSPVRADSWYYQTFATDETGTSNILFSQLPTKAGVSGVELIAPSYGSASGSREVALTNLRAFAAPAGGSPHVLTDAAYRLSVTILDVASMTFGTVSLTGVLNGLFTHEAASIANAFTGADSQSIRLGNNIYTVSLANYIAPGSPLSGLVGAITAFVRVDPAHAPEPSSLLLGGLGCVFVGFASWRKRRKGLLKAV